MARMRTIKQTVEYLKNKDPDTAVSTWWLRMMVKSGQIKHHKAGNKFLINLDALEDFLMNPPQDDSQSTNSDFGKLRKVY
ncbi:DNA binding domain-containing protein, excisionase family [Natronincola peptidivorans]|uniref:DNA binding domain-containing protein, excisionase family n=1 Tax=Natronincola peptidivorans TaxID=426128 RepID=A0A1I0E3D5_9FIRM|nr:hypothetical protein [Natronincola peptidivorans]SET38691.1 DNA binding domain-containing protein, excisionase family [Natronincola peptidivorans]